MKQQRGKVSKPRGLVQRREQADKEVKSWSPSQANSDLFLLFLFSTTYISPPYKQNLFLFYKHVRREMKKNSTINHTRNNMLKQKRKNTNTNTKVEKKRCNYRILSDYIKHQTSTREVREVSESRYPRSADYIYIYTLYKRKVHQTLTNARKQKDHGLLLVPCSMSVCLSADILQTSMFPRKLRVGKLCWVPNLQ